MGAKFQRALTSWRIRPKLRRLRIDIINLSQLARLDVLLDFTYSSVIKKNVAHHER